MAGFIDLDLKRFTITKLRTLLYLVILLNGTLVVVDMTKAQISPGDLHKSHESLEGLSNCNKCHDSKKDNMAENCLSCHGAIKQQLLKSKGLHAQKEFAKCELCHVEHQGRDFDLIFFKGGVESFDHLTTGYKLEGKHAFLDCRQCHNPKNIQNAEELKNQSVPIERTYLGLGQDCISCHFDEHRGQLSKDCTNCHNLESWKPVPGFDHSRTDYPLTGQHQKVECVKCHQQIVDKSNKQDPTYLSFAKQKFGQCSNCHSDFHQGKLGPNCNQCHNTSGWGSVKMTNFDHSRTEFPLLGMHAKVECEKCHGDRTTKKLKFANCKDCHNDFHKGEFVNRDSKGACEECHTVQGFMPSTFTMLKHDGTLFKLAGSHQAVACFQCHLTETKGKKEYKFSFESLRCPECHKDPHHGQVNGFKENTGCETCHRSASWAEIEFDHNRTNYPLEGAHAGVACNKCHKSDTVGGEKFMHFKPVDSKCSSCHSNDVSIERLKG